MIEPFTSFQEACERLLLLAPSPLFARARRLYLLKYPLEDAAEWQGPGASRFRTFLLEEEVQEEEASGAGAGLRRVRGLRFALVHWQAPQIPLDDYAAYLERRWQLPPTDLQWLADPWFREGGSCASFRATVVIERRFSGASVPAVQALVPPFDQAASS